MLYNINSKEWDEDLLELFNIPKTILPQVEESSHEFGQHKDTKIKITGIMAINRQHYLSAVFSVNSMKATFGTGCFLMANTGSEPKYSNQGLLTTIGYGVSNTTAYALEGSIFSCGTIVKWLRDGLGFFKDASETEALINKDWNSNGVLFIPALSGLEAALEPNH